jgi:hypothetical protein
MPANIDRTLVEVKFVYSPFTLFYYEAHITVSK